MVEGEVARWSPPPEEREKTPSRHTSNSGVGCQASLKTGKRISMTRYGYLPRCTTLLDARRVSGEQQMKGKQLVLEHLEGLSGRMLEDSPEAIRALIAPPRFPYRA
tara:strand:- start:3452 stop:3769 length:318 start_codon:yes stop_codon:yes gene_type:complete